MSSYTEFRDLHTSGTFILPNVVNVGEATLFEAMGVAAIATTSAGFAATLGRMDQAVTRDEVLAHVEVLTDAVSVPVSVDAEDGYAANPDGVARTIELFASAGAVGISIEDYAPSTCALYPDAVALERIEAAVVACRNAGMVLTARSEGLLYNLVDEDTTIKRLIAYRDAGADCLYAPGIVDVHQLGRIADAVSAPINALMMPGGPTAAEFAAAGARRLSVGSWFSRAATGLTTSLLSGLLTGDGLPQDLPNPDPEVLQRAWG